MRFLVGAMGGKSCSYRNLLDIQHWSLIVPVCASLKYWHYSSKRHYSAYCNTGLFPYVPSEFTSTIGANRHYPTGAVETSTIYFDFKSTTDVTVRWGLLPLAITVGVHRWLLPLVVTVGFCLGCYRWLLPLVFAVGFYRWLLPLVVAVGCFRWSLAATVGCFRWLCLRLVSAGGRFRGWLPLAIEVDF